MEITIVSGLSQVQAGYTCRVYDVTGNIIDGTSGKTSILEAMTVVLKKIQTRIEDGQEALTKYRRAGVNKKVKQLEELQLLLKEAQKALEVRLCAELELLAKTDALVFINPRHGDVDRRDIPVPGDWRNIRGGVSVRTWPIAQVGDTITHNEKEWRVVANFVYGGVSGRYVNVFSIYAIIPA